MLCTWVMGPVVTIVTAIYRIFVIVLGAICTAVKQLVVGFREIVKEVCGWVDVFGQGSRSWMEKVCGWLPGWLGWLEWVCRWVSKTVYWITVTATWLCDTFTTVLLVPEWIWDWTCTNIFGFVRVLVGSLIIFVFVLLQIVCWVLDWIMFRWIRFLLCRTGHTPLRGIKVCIKVLETSQGETTRPERIREMIDGANKILKQCNLVLLVDEITRVTSDDFFVLDPRNLLHQLRFLAWALLNSCGCCDRVTVFVVKDIVGMSGFAKPFRGLVAIDSTNSEIGITLAHEIMHVGMDQFIGQHSNDPNNLMSDGSGTEITPDQCCWVRTSRFTTPMGEVGAPS